MFAWALWRALIRVLAEVADEVGRDSRLGTLLLSFPPVRRFVFEMDEQTGHRYVPRWNPKPIRGRKNKYLESLKQLETEEDDDEGSVKSITNQSSSPHAGSATGRVESPAVVPVVGEVVSGENVFQFDSVSKLPPFDPVVKPPPFDPVVKPLRPVEQHSPHALRTTLPPVATIERLAVLRMAMPVFEEIEDGNDGGGVYGVPGQQRTENVLPVVGVPVPMSRSEDQYSTQSWEHPGAVGQDDDDLVAVGAAAVVDSTVWLTGVMRAMEYSYPVVGEPSVKSSSAATRARSEVGQNYERQHDSTSSHSRGERNSATTADRTAHTESSSKPVGKMSFVTDARGVLSGWA